MCYYKIKTKEGEVLVNFTTFKKLLKHKRLSLVMCTDSDNTFLGLDKIPCCGAIIQNYQDFLKTERHFARPLSKLDCKFISDTPLVTATF